MGDIEGKEDTMRGNFRSLSFFLLKFRGKKGPSSACARDRLHFLWVSYLNEV